MRNLQRAVVAMSAFSALCALRPGFAGWMTTNISAPAMAFMARIGPFAALALIAVAIFRKPRIMTATVTALAMFCITWVPPMAMPGMNVPDASQSDIIKLCHALTADLNAMGRCVPDPDEAMIIAQNVMNAPSAPRSAYFPGLMKRLSLAGIFIPVTGEAIVDMTRHAAGLVFTAAHELAHMRGIACETQANIAAYEACVSMGGAAEYSAKIWALAYAFSRLATPEISLNIHPEILSDIQKLPASGENCAQYARLADYLANAQK